MYALTVFLLGIIDRYRGSGRGLPRLIEKVLYGAAALFVMFGAAESYELLSDWKFALTYLGLFSVGASITWGTTIGGGVREETPDQFEAHARKDRKEGTGDWYIFGPVYRSWKTALLIRGFLWGALPAIPLWYFVGGAAALVMAGAFTIAMLCAVLLANSIDGSFPDRLTGRLSVFLAGDDGRWARQEFYRGWIAGLLLLAMY